MIGDPGVRLPFRALLERPSEVGAPMKVIATGGLAPVFREGADLIEHEDPDLTIRGLVEIYRHNRPPP